MGSKERRERQKGELRDKILDAARLLFATNGYEATTMRMIANEIEYSATAIYSYFEDKEAMLRELCETDFSSLAQLMESSLQVSTPVERLQRIGELYVQFAQRYPHHYRFMFMSGRPSVDGIHAKDGAQGRAYSFIRKSVEDVIATGAVRPEFCDVDTLTQLFWACMHGVISLHLSASQATWINWRPVDEMAQLMMLVLAQGVGQQAQTSA